MKIYNIVDSRRMLMGGRLSRGTEVEIADGIRRSKSLPDLCRERGWHIVEPRPEVRCSCGGVYVAGVVMQTGTYAGCSRYVFVLEGEEE